MISATATATEMQKDALQSAIAERIHENCIITRDSKGARKQSSYCTYTISISCEDINGGILWKK